MGFGKPCVSGSVVLVIFHPEWDVRRLLVVVPEKDATVSHAEMNEFLMDKVAKWWLPDDLAIVTELPHTATGKISKKDLRAEFKDYSFPKA